MHPKIVTVEQIPCYVTCLYIGQLIVYISCCRHNIQHTIYMHEFDAQIGKICIHTHENHYLRYLDIGQSMAGFGQWHI
jgi:hypothetical protein